MLAHLSAATLGFIKPRIPVFPSTHDRTGAQIVFAGVSLEELTFRTIYTARNAALQIQAHTLGLVSPLNPAETRLASEYNLRPGPIMRAWEYWNARLDKAEGSRVQARKPAPKKSASGKKRRR